MLSVGLHIIQAHSALIIIDHNKIIVSYLIRSRKPMGGDCVYLLWSHCRFTWELICYYYWSPADRKKGGTIGLLSSIAVRRVTPVACLSSSVRVSGHVSFVRSSSIRRRVSYTISKVRILSIFVTHGLIYFFNQI